MNSQKSAIVSATLVVVALTISGCTASIASARHIEPPHGVRHTIPAPKSFVTEPSPVRTASGPIGASQASLQQLWALVDSGLRSGGSWPDRAAGQLPQDFSDFADAVAQRCEPQLSADQAQDLEGLREAVIAQAAQAGTDLTPRVSAYFAAATKYCM